MKQRTALALLAALFLGGCYMTGKVPPITNFLSGGNRLIADAIKHSAADWAQHGLEIANFVTVDDGRAGLPVELVSERELRAACPNGPPSLGGCTSDAMGDWQRMVLHERLASDRDALVAMVKHEIVHALVPYATHLEGKPGVFTASHTSDFITRADMEHLSRFTEVTPSQVPFFGEPV